MLLAGRVYRNDRKYQNKLHTQIKKRFHFPHNKPDKQQSMFPVYRYQPFLPLFDSKRNPVLQRHRFYHVYASQQSLVRPTKAQPKIHSAVSLSCLNANLIFVSRQEVLHGCSRLSLSFPFGECLQCRRSQIIKPCHSGKNVFALHRSGFAAHAFFQVKEIFCRWQGLNTKIPRFYDRGICEIVIIL